MVRVENVENHLEVKRKGGLFRMQAAPAHNGSGGDGGGDGNGNVDGGGNGSGGGGDTDQVDNLLSYVNTQILTNYG